MIIYSVTTALEENSAKDWEMWMRNVQIPAIMATGSFVDFRFVRMIPSEGVDASYNIQLRCKDAPTLNNYRAFQEPELLKAEAARYEGKMASFQSVMEHLIDG